MELKLESSDVDGAEEALLAARLHVHHPSHAHHRVDVLQAHLQEGNIMLCLHTRLLRFLRGETFQLFAH